MANESKGQKDFGNKLEALFAKHDKASAEQSERLERSRELNQQRINQFRTFETGVIKPLLEQMSAKLKERGYAVKIAEMKEPEIGLGLEVGADDYIGFSLRQMISLQVKIAGRPLAGQLLASSGFKWKGTTNEQAVNEALLVFADKVLTRPPK